MRSEERECCAKCDELLKRMTRRLQQYQVDNRILAVLQKVFEKEFGQENVVLSSPARTRLFQQVSKVILMDVLGKIGGTKEQMNMSTYKKYSREDQRALAIWAADCAERVLPLFEQSYPADDRPRKAIEACRTWVRTGVFRMAEIRGASLAAHAAAREAKENEAACLAAHAAGQAVATAHVPQHAYGGAYYALKAIAAMDPAKAKAKVLKERSWQSRRIPERLREEVMKRIITEIKGNRVTVKIQKGKGF